MPEQVWQALIVEGVTPHLDPRLRQRVAQAYDFIAEARAANRATVGLSTVCNCSHARCRWMPPAAII
jgi:hypothetical protein